MKVHDLTEVNVEAALDETFTTTTILTEKRNAENQPISVSFCCSICVADLIIIISVTIHTARCQNGLKTKWLQTSENSPQSVYR